MKSLLAKFHERRVWQALGLFVGVGYAVLEGTSLFIENGLLPAWVFRGVALVLALGLPVLVVTAWVQGGSRLARESGVASVPASQGVTRLFTWQRAFVGGVLAFAALGLVTATDLAIEVTGFGTAGRVEAALAEAIPEIERLANEELYEEAFALARATEVEAPGLAELDEIRWTFASNVNLISQPEGAEVYRRAYGAAEAEAELLGQTPLTGVSVPSAVSVYTFSLAGHRSVERVGIGSPPVILDPLDESTEGMVRVDGFEVRVQGEAIDVPDFFLDRHEVSNREYQLFVDAGGYERPERWDPFVEDGTEVDWEEGIARLVDRTGRPGPSTWEIGALPDGQDDHPVGGLSWYEAAAYARFTGKSLPTVHHWRRAFAAGQQAYVVPLSNLEGAGSTPVGERAGISRFGTLDMAGNVREWTHNETGGQRYIMGGGWDDPAYIAIGDFAQGPFDRSPTNGVRLAVYEDEGAWLERTRAPLEERVLPDFSAEPLPPDAVFDAYLRMFDYDRTDLDPQIIAVDTTRYWVRETVSIRAAYGNERFDVYLHIPHGAERPLRPVVWYPGSSAVVVSSIDRYRTTTFDWLIRSGRAVALPAVQGTFGRQSPLVADARERGLAFPVSARPTVLYRDHVVQWVQDVQRTVDFLQERDDLDGGSVAYFGASWGGSMGGIVLAVEPRFKTGILRLAGYASTQAPPEVRLTAYLPRVSLPVLMMSGRYDNIYPLETSARPYFERIGTDASLKRHVISDGGHFVSRVEVIAHSLEWLDRYAGPVR
jgi:dienelactone hydrolase